MVILNAELLYYAFTLSQQNEIAFCHVNLSLIPPPKEKSLKKIRRKSNSLYIITFKYMHTHTKSNKHFQSCPCSELATLQNVALNFCKVMTRLSPYMQLYCPDIDSLSSNTVCLFIIMSKESPHPHSHQNLRFSSSYWSFTALLDCSRYSLHLQL